jgi:hypothetical protein
MQDAPVLPPPPWPKPIPDVFYGQPAVRDGTMDPLQLHDFYRGASPAQLQELMRRYQQRNQEQDVRPPPYWNVWDEPNHRIINPPFAPLEQGQ